MNEKIFISYRREDSRGEAGRLYDHLEAHFGRDHIFMDVDTIQPGMDFVKVIERAIDSTDAFLVVIGPNWLTAKDTAGNSRLENPEDLVRLEVASALDREVRVIPVLVDRAMMPHSTDLPDCLKPLTRRNAIEISHTRFKMDSERLIRALEEIFKQLSIEHKQVEEQADAERLANEMVDAEREAAEKTETERVAREKASADNSTSKEAQQYLKSTGRKAKARSIDTGKGSKFLPTFSWAIGGAIGGTIGGVIGCMICQIMGTYSRPIEGIYGGIPFTTVSGALSGAFIGFVIGIAFRVTERDNWWKQGLIASIGAAIGALISMSIGGQFNDVSFIYGIIGSGGGVIISGMIYMLRKRSRTEA